MRPQGTRVWRRNGHKARRGEPTGRRASRIVRTTYGHRQEARDQQARMQPVYAALRAEREALAEMDAAA